jgi:hypothetical protein
MNEFNLIGKLISKSALKQGTTKTGKNYSQIFVEILYDNGYKKLNVRILCWNENARKVNEIPLNTEVKVVSWIYNKDWEGKIIKQFECKSIEVITAALPIETATVATVAPADVRTDIPGGDFLEEYNKSKPATVGDDNDIPF